MNMVGHFARRDESARPSSAHRDGDGSAPPPFRGGGAVRRVVLLSFVFCFGSEALIARLLMEGSDPRAEDDGAPAADSTRRHWTQQARFYFGEQGDSDPSAEDESTLTVPDGSYHFPPSSASSANETSSHRAFDFRPVLYVTTHMSDAHIWYLDVCWPPAMVRSELLSRSDVMVYLTYADDAVAGRDRRRVVNVLRRRFRRQSLTVHVRENPGYEEGALAAMRDATVGGWFEGYDWVIRLNPDVIIRNETFILNTMKYDLDATGILIDCHPRHPLRMINTDFFAVKPSVLGGDAFADSSFSDGKATVEGNFANDIRESILARGDHRWVPGSKPTWHTCRAGFGRRMEDADVVHHHLGADLSRPHVRMLEPDEGDRRCPIPF